MRRYRVVEMDRPFLLRSIRIEGRAVERSFWTRTRAVRWAARVNLAFTVPGEPDFVRVIDVRSES